MILLFGLVACSGFFERPPPLPVGLVGRPWWRVGEEEYQAAGTGTLLSVGGRRIVVSALSNFGEDAGLEPAWTAEDVVRRVETAGLSDFDGGTMLVLGQGRMLALPAGAGMSPGEDIIAFCVPDGPALAVSPQEARIGQRVWLAAELGEEAGLHLHAARLRTVGPWAFDVELLEPTPTDGAAGAPLLDEDGLVVGIFTDEVMADAKTPRAGALPLHGQLDRLETGLGEAPP